MPIALFITLFLCNSIKNASNEHLSLKFKSTLNLNVGSLGSKSSPNGSVYKNLGEPEKVTTLDQLQPYGECVTLEPGKCFCQAKFEGIYIGPLTGDYQMHVQYEGVSNGRASRFVLYRGFYHNKNWIIQLNDNSFELTLAKLEEMAENPSFELDSPYFNEQQGIGYIRGFFFRNVDMDDKREGYIVGDFMMRVRHIYIGDGGRKKAKRYTVMLYRVNIKIPKTQQVPQRP